LKAGRGKGEGSNQEIKRPLMMRADLEGFGTAVGLEYSEARLFEKCTTKSEDRGLLVHHQDGR
jgi:hypothetical protein